CNPNNVYQCNNFTGEVCEYGFRDACKQCGALSCPTSINSTKSTNSAPSVNSSKSTNSAPSIKSNDPKQQIKISGQLDDLETVVEFFEDKDSNDEKPNLEKAIKCIRLSMMARLKLTSGLAFVSQMALILALTLVSKIFTILLPQSTSTWDTNSDLYLVTQHALNMGREIT
ncbi:28911_t:CDS:2, partial [Racocetra persica]